MAANADAGRDASPAAVRAAALRHGGVGEHAVDLGTAEAPVELLQRHHRHAHVRHAAVDRGRGQPELARAPAAARRERRREAHLGHAEDRRHLGRIAGEGVDGEAVEILDGEAGVVERGEDRRAHHRRLGLGERLPALVVRRRADADHCGLVLDAHGSENRVLTIARSNPAVAWNRKRCPDRGSLNDTQARLPRLRRRQPHVRGDRRVHEVPPEGVRGRDQVRRGQRAHEDRDQEQDQRLHPEPDVQQGRAPRGAGARVQAQEPRLDDRGRQGAPARAAAEVHRGARRRSSSPRPAS